MLMCKFVKAGGWRTLESFWNAKATAFFKYPEGARIKIRYGGAVGFDRQVLKLDGYNFKKLVVGTMSIGYARIQIYVPYDTDVKYDLYPGDVAVRVPINF